MGPLRRESPGTFRAALRAQMDRTTKLKVSCATRVDLDGTPATPVFVEYAAEDDSLRRDTPLLPAAFPVRTERRATLTVLTGLQAGRIVAVEGIPMTIGRGVDADLVVQDTGVSRHHVRIARTAEGAFYAEDLGSTNGTYRGADRIGLTLLCAGDLLQLGPSLQVRFAVVDAVEESLYRQLYESSVNDPLTRVFNRQYLRDRLFAEIAHAQRSHGEVAILMIDVDHLKHVNDHFGHLAGDRALCTIASRILRVLRVEDMLARYGGDEFVVVAAGAGPVEARQLAERVRRAVEESHMSAQGRDVHVTASIGLASLAELAESDEPVAALFALADARMYGAKVSGRNRVGVVTPAPAHPAG